MSSGKRKNRKYRGSKTHGGGSMKKRRGAGSRAGRGRAGSGKRGDQQKPSYWRTWQMGKHGFTQHNQDPVEAVNVSDLDSALSKLVDSGVAVKKGNSYIIDLKEAGVDKLLGSGQVRNVLEVTVKAASASAISKIEAAGGSVKLTGEGEEADGQ